MVLPVDRELGCSFCRKLETMLYFGSNTPNSSLFLLSYLIEFELEYGLRDLTNKPLPEFQKMESFTGILNKSV